MGSRSTPVRSAGARKTTWSNRLRRRRDCAGSFGGDDESSGRIPETCARLSADGKICTRSAEQGDLAPHGGEMAPLCGEIRQQRNARGTPGAAEAPPDVCGGLTNPDLHFVLDERLT